MSEPRPDHQSAACMNLQMLRVSHYVLKCFDDVYREFGLRATQIPVLHHLARSGGASIRDIAEATESERSVMFRKVRVLVDHGWVDESEDASRRERCYVLTSEGHALLERIEPAREAVQSRLLGRLNRDEQDLLLTLCARGSAQPGRAGPAADPLRPPAWRAPHTQR